MTAQSTDRNSTPDFSELNAQGLNLQAVFNVAELPHDVVAALPLAQEAPYRQLLLIGHRGGLLWQQLNAAGMEGEHPIDSFSRAHISAWLERWQPDSRYCFVYPGPTSVGLQRLGSLAGWHHPSPFMVGIHAGWGSWFAYRAVVLADTHLASTAPLASASPCDSCASRVCVSQCPAQALTNGFNLAACLDYRRQPDSACQDRCMARNSCPVGEENRYSDAQISYHYGRSMKLIRERAK
jgi:epoxyqueuosine reductase